MRGEEFSVQAHKKMYQRCCEAAMGLHTCVGFPRKVAASIPVLGTAVVIVVPVRTVGSR